MVYESSKKFGNHSILYWKHVFPYINGFSNSFFSFCIWYKYTEGNGNAEWDRFDVKIRNLLFIYRFKNLLSIYFKTDENSIFDVHKPIGFLYRLKINFSHLNEHTFCHNFGDTVNPLFLCNVETKTTSDYRLCCSLFSEQSTNLLESLCNLENTLSKHCDHVDILFYGSYKYSFSTNNKSRNVLKNHSFE